MTDGNALARLTQAERLLAEATVEQLPQVSQLADYAEVARIYAQRASLGTKAINHAQKVKLAAERKMADLVDEGQANGQIATDGRPETVDPGNGLATTPATLDTLGIPRKRLHEARAIRDAFTAEDIDRVVEQANAEDKEVTRAELLRAAKSPHVSHNSGENEWYTPPQYIEAARRVMGGIDLDPASSDRANELVQATVYFTKEDNGLRRPWSGRVWMNPPYSKDLIWSFCERLCEFYSSGDVSEAIVLVNNATETAAFQRMAEVASAMCFHARRIKYLNADLEVAETPLQGQAFLYFGENVERFRSEFVQFGFTVAA